MTRTCENCGGPIVECELDHQPGDLCLGWRHFYDDPALFHSIVCSTSSGRDDRGWRLAYPASELPRPGITFTYPGRLVGVIAGFYAIAVFVVAVLLGWRPW